MIMRQFKLGPLDLDTENVDALVGDHVIDGGIVNVIVVTPQGSVGWPEVELTGSLPSLLGWLFTWCYPGHASDDELVRMNAIADAVALISPDCPLLREVTQNDENGGSDGQ